MDTLAKTVRRFGYSDVEDFAKDHAKLLVWGKIEEYQNKNLYFEKKYSQKYKQFAKELADLKNDEDFDKEDDFMEWRFCMESLEMYKSELRSWNIVKSNKIFQSYNFKLSYIYI